MFSQGLRGLRLQGSSGKCSGLPKLQPCLYIGYCISKIFYRFLILGFYRNHTSILLYPSNPCSKENIYIHLKLVYDVVSIRCFVNTSPLFKIFGILCTKTKPYDEYEKMPKIKLPILKVIFSFSFICRVIRVVKSFIS